MDTIRPLWVYYSFSRFCFSEDLAKVIGFNVETVEYKNINFTVWDVSGQDTLCVINNQNIDAIIFMVDSHDRDPERI